MLAYMSCKYQKILPKKQIPKHVFAPDFMPEIIKFGDCVKPDEYSVYVLSTHTLILQARGPYIFSRAELI